MIQFKYGLLAEYQALTEKSTNDLYFTTDTHEIFRGTDQVAINNIVYTGVTGSSEVLPPSIDAADASDNKIYITTTVAYDGEAEVTTNHLWMRTSTGTSYQWTEVGGSGEVKDLDLTAFLEGVVVTVIPEYKSDDTHETTATDDTIPTTKAVATAIASSFVDVSYDASGEGTTAVWTFTAKDGTIKTINTPKENFLQEASYDNATHDLTLTMSSGDKVVVPLDDLVPSAMSTEDVATPTDGSGAITVELGTNGSLGGYKTGDVIEEGTSVQTILKKLLAKQVPPTYKSPALTLSVRSGGVFTTDQSVEIGSMISPGVISTFTQNNAGDITSHTISCSRNGAAYTELHSRPENLLYGGPLDGGTLVQITSTIKFKSTVAYGEGAILDDNLGDPYPEGHIAAGSLTSTEIVFSTFRTGYFWGVLGTPSSEIFASSETAAAILRSALDAPSATGATVVGKVGAKDGAYAAGNIGTTDDPVIKASLATSPKCIYVACPADKTGVTKVIMPSASNADATGDFKKLDKTFAVPGANGYTAIDYNVWVYEPATITSDQTFVVTLG